MRKLFTLFFFILVLPASVFAQEDPYYELPKNRKTKHEIMAMPNLDAEVVKWYISASGGLKPGNSYFETNLEVALIKRKLINTFWDINFGYNQNYNLYYETGIMQNPVFVSSYFAERISRSLPSVFKSGNNYLSIPFRVKKRVVMLDKVTKMAWINVGAAVIYSPGMKSKELSSINVDLLRVNNRVVVDTVGFRYISRQQSVPLNFELMTEIGGKIVEKLEISVFAKAIFYPKPVLKSEFAMVYDTDNVSTALQKSNLISMQFGLNLKLNYPAVIRYESKL